MALTITPKYASSNQPLTVNATCGVVTICQAPKGKNSTVLHANTTALMRCGDTCFDTDLAVSVNAASHSATPKISAKPNQLKSCAPAAPRLTTRIPTVAVMMAMFLAVVICSLSSANDSTDKTIGAKLVMIPLVPAPMRCKPKNKKTLN